MLKLFSPITLGHTRISNRLALNALPSGCAVPGGFITSDLARYYLRVAQGGAGLLVLEPTCALPPLDRATPHVGLYADAQVSDLHHCIGALLHTGATVLVMLDQPLAIAGLSAAENREVGEAFIAAAWRALAAGAHGIMLSAADDGPFAQLLSPLRNTRTDEHGGSATNRLRLLPDVVEGINRWMGHQFVVGVRLNVEEFAPGGLSLQDARMIATRLVSAGARLIEASAETAGDAPVARFPGWRVPLAAGIKNVVDVPVMVGGLLDDPDLADGVIREGSADIVTVGERLRDDPDWPRAARDTLMRRDSLSR